MYTKEKIYALIKSNDLSISYPDFVDDFTVNELPVVYGSGNFAGKLFEENYHGDRLSVMVGPVVKSLSQISNSERKQFKNYPYCFDLRKSNGEFVIRPNETIAIPTLERIKTGKSVGGIVLPKLACVDAGLIYIPSYIDPEWDGVLQAVIVNATTNSIKIRMNEKVGIVKFHSVDGTLESNYREEFIRKSHHYGQGWKRIIEEDFNPLPTKKDVHLSNHGVFSFARRLTKSLNINATKILSSIGILSILSMVFYVGYYSRTLSQLSLVPQQIKSLENKMSLIPESESSEIQIGNKAGSGKHTIYLDSTIKPKFVIFQVKNGSPVSVVDYSTVKSDGGKWAIVVDFVVTEPRIDKVLLDYIAFF